MNYLNWLNRYKYFIVLAIIGLFFLLIYSSLYIGLESKFTWPDETANYYFTKLFAEKSQLSFYEPLNQIADGLVRPRSIGYTDGYLVPGSFLGMILIYGLIAKVFGSWIILYLTPFFAVVGVLFFYLLIKEIFNKKISFISSLLLFLLPTYWYYSSHSMLHNIFFISLFIIGIYFLVKYLTTNNNPKTINFKIILSGIFIGLALITRTSEITWIFVVMLILFITNWRKIGWRNLILFIGIIILIFIPILLINNRLYNSPASFSYSKDTLNISSLETFSSTIFLKLKQLIIPFGVNFNQIGNTTYQYLLIIFPWFSILLIISFIWLLRNIILLGFKKIFPEIDLNLKLPNKQKIYLCLYSFTSLWLVIYYGSWEIYEHFDRSQIILGTSYLRYWLPIYIFGLPIIILFLVNIYKYFKKKWIENIFIIFIILFFIYFSVNTIIFDSFQGLVKIKGYLNDYIYKRNEIISLTENNSVIIAGFNDKVFFPERKVIVYLPSDKVLSEKILKKLINEVPIYYYYSPLDEQGNQTMEFMQKSDFILKEVKIFTQFNEILYQVKIN